MSVVLGLNAFHGDASACLVVDGQLVAAAEEERFRRIKHCAGFPREAAAWCLRDAGIALADVEHVAVNQDARANIGRKLAYVVKGRPDLRLVLERLRNRKERAGIGETLQGELGEPFRGKAHSIEHHLAHLGSGFLASPFDEAVAVSVDGFGDFASAAWGVGRGATVDVDDKVYFPHSLGIFYQALTQFLGFPHYGDEYKMMGLAASGEPAYLDRMRRIVLLEDDGRFRLDLAYFRHATEKVEYEWEGGEPAVGTLYTGRLEELLGGARGEEEITQRHRDIACSAQAMYEEALFHLLRALHARYGLDALALAGGCAMNSVANGKITTRTPFRRLYVQPAAGDAGGALGAAALVSAALHPGKRIAPMAHASWGPAFSDEAVRAVLDAATLDGCSVAHAPDEAALCADTAAAIERGEVVGWFQGRMEWGPRALGNRSIVCDPRRADVKELLNAKIKRRESFRPFAPSILRAAVPEWFEVDADVPFMTEVHPIRPDKRALIPAVTHVDGTGRLQTVAPEANPLFHGLITAFGDATGVPMVLNTSFNENEPVVCTPREALDCFLRTRMDLLAMGRWTVRRG